VGEARFPLNIEVHGLIISFIIIYTPARTHPARILSHLMRAVIRRFKRFSCSIETRVQYPGDLALSSSSETQPKGLTSSDAVQRSLISRILES